MVLRRAAGTDPAARRGLLRQNPGAGSGGEVGGCRGGRSSLLVGFCAAVKGPS